ncbi:hypothetical protein I5535_12645 [Rhodobacteraceae bacterium F11138]|nr:hypothetical protein [Rhodobacteraceae bacterium F11138]
MTLRADLDLVTAKLAEADALLRSAQAAQTQAIAALESAVKRADKDGLNTLSPEAWPITDHRRAHRSGPPPKIESDPELQAFITAGIDRMTFVQIADDVAAHFPPQRQVKKSAIHAWWHRSKRRRRSSAIPPNTPGGPG